VNSGVLLDMSSMSIVARVVGNASVSESAVITLAVSEIVVMDGPEDVEVSCSWSRALMLGSII
jgi:hypothetical protein